MVWLILIGFLVIVDLFITFVGAGLRSDPRAQLFSLPAILVVGIVGLAGIWFSHRTGFPPAWDPAVPALPLSDRHRDRHRPLPVGRRCPSSLDRDVLDARWRRVQRSVPGIAPLLSGRRDHRRSLIPASSDPTPDVRGLARRVRELHLPLLTGHPGAAAGPGRSRVFTTAMISPSSPIRRTYAA